MDDPLSHGYTTRSHIYAHNEAVSKNRQDTDQREFESRQKRVMERTQSRNERKKKKKEEMRSPFRSDRGGKTGEDSSGRSSKKMNDMEERVRELRVDTNSSSNPPLPISSLPPPPPPMKAF